LLVKIIVNPMPVPSHIDPSVPPSFDAWFAKATSRDPHGRFQTARAFADALSVSLGIAAPMGPRMSSISSMDRANESGAYHVGPPSGPHAAAGVSSEPVLRPLSVTMAGSDVPAGVPTKGG